MGASRRVNGAKGGAQCPEPLRLTVRVPAGVNQHMCSRGDARESSRRGILLRQMKRQFPKTTRRICLAVLTLVLLVISSPLSAATPQQVDEMLTKAKAFLYNKQRNGNWEVADKAEADDQFYSP